MRYNNISCCEGCKKIDNEISNKTKEKFKPVQIILPCGEHWELQVPQKACKAHIDHIFDITNSPTYNGGVQTSLLNAFPDLTDIDAIKIYALYLLIMNPEWELKEVKKDANGSIADPK